jgi:4-amino-4-deoxy-L-arabinose transferase-like glycosyltransferase
VTLHLTEQDSEQRKLRIVPETTAASSIQIRERRANRRYAWHAAAVAGVFVLAAVLRFVFIGNKSIWSDEGYSIAIAQLSWHEFRRVVTNGEANMGLYYFLLRFWLHLGQSDAVVRSLSAVVAIATVPVTYLLGTRLFNRYVGLIAAMLLAVNGYHIRHAQNARSYALAALLAAVSCLFFVKGIERPTRRNMVLYLVSSLLGVYSHFFVGLVMVAQWASLTTLPRKQVPWRWVIKSIVVTGVFVAPLLVFILKKDTGQIDWIPKTSWAGLAFVWSEIAGHGGARLAAAYGALVLAGTAVIVNRWRLNAPEERWHAALTSAWLVMPLILALFISIKKPLIFPRYFIVCLPAIALLAAGAICSIRPQWARVATLAIVVALAMRGTASWYRQMYEPALQDWRSATQQILTQARPGDGLIIYHGFVVFPYEHYRELTHGSREVPELAYPLRSDASILRDPAAYRDSLLEPDSPLVQGLAAKYRRIWLIPNKQGPVTQDLQGFLAATYPRQSCTPHGEGVDVCLYSK